jgi:exopolyphosphatase/guanosine-5'-triphosphate,3'-diphosphate pyrophosphatase
VRAVATNTLRVAKNAPQFLEKAEAALGFPDRGHRRPRGGPADLPRRRAHAAVPQAQQLVVDIGGGSTEFIIGQNIDPVRLESLYMGCVSFSLRFFPDGKVDKRAFKAAELAARASCKPSCMPTAKPAGMRRSGRPARPRPWRICWN